jgi:hypothetical protein
MHRVLAAMVVALALLVGPAAGRLQDACLAAEPTLEELIELVRQNELLYEQIDVTMDMEYEVVGRGPMGDRPIEKGHGFREILKERARHRYVSQNGLYFSERLASFTTSDGSRHDVPVIAAFNGAETRTLTDRLGNVLRGRHDAAVPIWPHTLLLQSVQVPLSVYLAGADAIRRYGQGALDGRAGPRQIAGRSDWRGEPAIKVVAYFAPGPTFGGKWEIWLAENRGYIPVRTVGYQYWISHAVPTGEAEVLSWREVQPGIWFPAHVRATTVRPDLLQMEGRRVRNSTREWRLRAISLEPRHEASFFVVDFPAGTFVYEVSDNQVVRQYQQGIPATGRGRRAIRGWLLLLGLLGCLAGWIVYICVRCRRRSHQQALRHAP